MKTKAKALQLLLLLLTSVGMVNSALADMEDVKKAFDSSTSIAVYSKPDGAVTFDARPASDRFGFNSQPSFAQSENAPLPEEYAGLEALVLKQLKEQLPDYPFVSQKVADLPQKKSFGISTPDWSGTAHETLIEVSMIVKYTGFPGNGDKMTYSLEGDVILIMDHKNAKGKFKKLKPNAMGTYSLGRVTEQISFDGKTSVPVKNLDQLLEAMPPIRILEKLESKVAEGVLQFTTELTATDQE